MSTRTLNDSPRQENDQRAEASDLSRWSDAFVRAKQAEGVSPKTSSGYRDGLHKFNDWAASNNVSEVEALTANHVRDFMLFLQACGHNSGGQHRHYRVLKTFLRWYEAELEPERWKNPIYKVKAPHLVENAIDPVGLGDVDALLRACANNRQGVRAKAIFFTLLDTGLRAQELLGLNLEDLDQYTGEIQVSPGSKAKKWGNPRCATAPPAVESSPSFPTEIPRCQRMFLPLSILSKPCTRFAPR